ncbi:MAG TPA: SMP-30/gluconolactonase/LRE family protein [Solirubrobacterales bacterium]
MAGQKPGVLMEGIGLGESPRWHDGRLWFSDWVAHQVIALDPDGRHEVMAEVNAFPFSIDWVPDGPMLVTAGRKLLRLESDGTLTTHADLGELSEHGWNEIVIDTRGNTYVNGAGFDLMGGGEFAPGVVGLLRPDGSAEVVADEVAFPNGMAITPDGSTLIVADSYAKVLLAFDIGSDGTLSRRRTWAELGDGAPDGICLDADGAAWYADVPHRRCVRVAEGGEVLQTVEVNRGCFACMLGGEHGSTLFVNAAEWNGPEGVFNEPRTGRVLTVEAPTPHAGHP